MRTVVLEDTDSLLTVMSGPGGVQGRWDSRWTSEDEYRFPNEKKEKQSQKREHGTRCEA